MIDSIQIRNFQSLTDVSLDLAPLTVIVGPSSSGKSAFIRAFRALAGNRRGTDFITHGEKTASISAHISSTDSLRSGTVTLTRSTSTSPNSYVLIPDDPAHPHHPKAEFTKLGGEVPADVSAFLGIPTEQIPLAIASQFDKPYLLDTPGTEVARTLGSLTNAHVVLNASRESNRQKLANAQTLRTRSADLEAIQARVPEFRALKAQREALDTAERLISESQDLAARLSRLGKLIDTAVIAEQRIPALRDALRSIPEPLDLDAQLVGLQEARQRLDAYTRTIQAVSSAQRGVRGAQEALSSATLAHDEAQSALRAGMQDIAAGFESYFRENYNARDDGLIPITQAAVLAARYVAQLDS